MTEGNGDVALDSGKENGKTRLKTQKTVEINKLI